MAFTTEPDVRSRTRKALRQTERDRLRRRDEWKEKRRRERGGFGQKGEERDGIPTGEREGEMREVGKRRRKRGKRGEEAGGKKR